MNKITVHRVFICDAPVFCIKQNDDKWKTVFPRSKSRKICYYKCVHGTP